jgi:hypothetical protein
LKAGIQAGVSNSITKAFSESMHGACSQAVVHSHIQLLLAFQAYLTEPGFLDLVDRVQDVWEDMERTADEAQQPSPYPR